VNSDRPYEGPREVADERVDVRRHLRALRRGRLLIGVIVLVVTGVVFVVSLLATSRYEATSRLGLDEELAADSDSESITRRLAAAASVVNSAPVLAHAARLAEDPSQGELRQHVEASVEEDSALLAITGEADTAERAARRANAVAGALVRQSESTERDQLAQRRESVESEILELEAALPPAGSPDPTGIAEQVEALRGRLTSLRVREAVARPDLRVIEPATAPSDPVSPQPLRNTLFAAVASLFLALLVALGRDQLVPRATGPRELGRAVGLPVLATLPSGASGLRRTTGVAAAASQREAYQSLRNAVELTAPPGSSHTIVVTSPTRGEGKTTLTARLGWTLAAAGRDTLLVSADLRQPRLHEHFEVDPAVGLSELLEAAQRSGRAISKTALSRATLSIEAGARRRGRTRLSLIPSGLPPADPAARLSGELVASVMEQVRGLGYDYVLIDAPPLLGTADAHVLAQSAGELLLVSGLEVATVEQLLEAGDVIERLDVDALGVVVVGAQPETASPYRTDSGPGARHPRTSRLAVAGRGRSHGPDPDQRGHQPEVPPVQRVDEEAVDQQPAPGAEQSR
jgi:polysaccharide biosynthesis transport protein